MRGFIGKAITLAARIEPVTLPGQVWATTSFRSLFEAEGLEGYRFDILGRIPLAKDFGTEVLYEVHRKDEPFINGRTLASAVPVIASLEVAEWYRRQAVLQERYRELASLITDRAARQVLDQFYGFAHSLFPSSAKESEA
jgi:hypothetical protein